MVTRIGFLYVMLLSLKVNPILRRPKAFRENSNCLKKGIGLILIWRAHMSSSERNKRRIIAENRITDAINKGEFDNLKGKNKPLDPASYAPNEPDLPRNVDQLLAEAIKKGEFDNLPGKGKPIDLKSYFEVPEHLRMAYHMLKDSGFLPEEVRLKKEMESLKEKIQRCDSKDEKDMLNKQLVEVSQHYNFYMEYNMKLKKALNNT